MQAAAAVSGVSMLDMFTNKFKGVSTAFKSGLGGKELAADIALIGTAATASLSPTEKFVSRIKTFGTTAAESVPLTSRLGLAVGTLSRGLLIASPAIAAVAGGLILYANNTGGARDAANQFGAAIGNQLPILKPFGELLVGIAGKLGLTGESADEVAIHLERAGIGFSNMGTLWNNTIAGLINSSDEFSQKVGQNLLKASDAVVQMGTDFINQLTLTGNAWNTFIDQLAKKDYKGAVDSIGMAFAALPGIITTAISEFGDLMDGLWGVIEPALQQLGTNIMGILGEVAKRISDKFWSELQAAWNNASALVGMVGAFADNFNQALGSAFTNIGSQIQGWVQTNIVDPINR